MSERPPPTEDAAESEPLFLVNPSARHSARPSGSPPAVSRKSTADVPSSSSDWTKKTENSTLPFTISVFVAALFVLLAIFADVVASDLPIACKWHGSIFLFPNILRPTSLEAIDRDVLAREADWTISPVVRHGPTLSSGEERSPLLSPRSGHPFGTDREGRDVFARTIHGTRTYLVFALAAVLASLVLGGALGSLAGLFGGAADALLSRTVESISAFPPLVLVLGIQAAVSRPTAFTLFAAIALTRWPEIARLVRSEVLLATTRDYVLAARALGASPFRVLGRHIVPNVRAPLVVAAAASMSSIVLTEASLDFLRVGTAGGAASWGETMSQFRDTPDSVWLLVFPGTFLVVAVVACNVIGEAIRSALDPKSS